MAVRINSAYDAARYYASRTAKSASAKSTSNVKRHVKHKKRENPKKAVKKQNTPYKLRIYGVY